MLQMKTTTYRENRHPLLAFLYLTILLTSNYKQVAERDVSLYALLTLVFQAILCGLPSSSSQYGIYQVSMLHCIHIHRIFPRGL